MLRIVLQILVKNYVNKHGILYQVMYTCVCVCVANLFFATEKLHSEEQM